ncbi:MAG: type II asparaginase [Planctomycetota bacterium]|jgi:L-asparaginase
MKVRITSPGGWVLAVALLLQTAAIAHAETLPSVVILATGGTIAGAAKTETEAGYKSGQVGVEVLLEAVPELERVARATGEQVANVGSQNMSDEVWLKLANRINTLLAKPDVDAVVITHGTDTMEETAYFLSLVVRSKKPVVMTGSMRPSTALSADGPLNIFNAVAVAADPDAKGRGVMVVANDEIHAARAIIKSNTTEVSTFYSDDHGLIGTVRYGDALFFRSPYTRHTADSEFSVEGMTELPRVDIIAIYEDVPGDLITAAAKAGAKGIVTAGVGNGNMTDAAVDALAAAVKQGVVCVRSSRVQTGFVGRNIEIDDDALGFVASYELSPHKARILLRLALTKTSDPVEIQKYFGMY